MTAPLPDAVEVVEPTSALSRADLPAHLLSVALLTIESDTVVTVGERRIHAENLAVMAAALIQSQAARIAELEAFIASVEHGYQVNHTSKWCHDQARSLLSQPKDSK